MCNDLGLDKLPNGLPEEVVLIREIKRGPLRAWDIFTQSWLYQRRAIRPKHKM
jgi:hypothetical protein